MYLLERDVEEIILKSSEEDLIKRGLYFSGSIVKSQLRIGNYGIADIVTYDKCYPPDISDYPPDIKAVITVYELKKEKISVSSFFQAVRYIKGIQRYLKLTRRNIYQYHYRICLIGKETNDSDIVYLPDLFNGYDSDVSVRMYWYNYDINGVQFEEAYGRCLIDEGFKL